MTTVNIHQAKTHLSRLVEQAAAGEEIIIARNGRPVAKLVGIHEGHSPRVPGFMRGQLVITDDFDAPLPAEILRHFTDET